MSQELKELLHKLNEKFEAVGDLEILMDQVVSRLNTEQKELEELDRMMKVYEVSRDKSSIVKFNVGGQVFATSESTINKRVPRLDAKKGTGQDFHLPNLLQALISGIGDVGKDKQTGCIFIDRNPTYFNYLLDYLRSIDTTEPFELPDTDQGRRNLFKEAVYFKFYGLVDQLLLNTIKIDSAIVNSDRLKLNLFHVCEFGMNVTLTLLYRGSRDGFKSSDFHAKCDNIPNTLAIIKSKSNIFGGFTTQTWEPSNTYKEDPDAYLFSLENKLNTPLHMRFLSEQKPCNAIYCGANYSVTFGAGLFGKSDLYISSNANSNRDSLSNLGFSYKFDKYARGSDEARSFLAGSANFQISEIEVFSVTHQQY